MSKNRRKDAQQLVKGGYIVSDCFGKPHIVLIASGSEVATLIEGAEKLRKDKIKVRVVSIPSEGLFRDQKASYRETVLPPGVKRFGLTSGLPITLQGLVGDNGIIHGMPSFGYSAPYSVLDEKLGFTGDNVYKW